MARWARRAWWWWRRPHDRPARRPLCRRAALRPGDLRGPVDRRHRRAVGARGRRHPRRPHRRHRRSLTSAGEAAHRRAGTRGRPGVHRSARAERAERPGRPARGIEDPAGHHQRADRRGHLAGADERRLGAREGRLAAQVPPQDRLDRPARLLQAAAPRAAGDQRGRHGGRGAGAGRRARLRRRATRRAAARADAAARGRSDGAGCAGALERAHLPAWLLRQDGRADRARPGGCEARRILRDAFAQRGLEDLRGARRGVRHRPRGSDPGGDLAPEGRALALGPHARGDGADRAGARERHRRDRRRLSLRRLGEWPARLVARVGQRGRRGRPGRAAPRPGPARSHRQGDGEGPRCGRDPARLLRRSGAEEVHGQAPLRGGPRDGSLAGAGAHATGGAGPRQGGRRATQPGAG